MRRKPAKNRLSDLVVTFCVIALIVIYTIVTDDDNIEPIPAVNSPVTDITGTLSPEQISRLQQKLLQFEQSHGNKIAVLIVPSTQSETIEQYAVRAFETIKPGRQQTDDGALLVVAKHDSKLRIEVGYGLEGVLNDATDRRIIDENITPRFKAGDFYGGIKSGIDNMQKVISGEPLPLQTMPPGSDQDVTLSFGDYVLLIIVVIIIIAIGGISGGGTGWSGGGGRSGGGGASGKW